MVASAGVVEISAVVSISELTDWLVEADWVLSAAVVVCAVLTPAEVSNDVSCVELAEVLALSLVTLVEGIELVVSSTVVTRVDGEAELPA